MRNEERNQRIVEMYLAGHTYQEVGEEFGLTRQRVEQIVRLRTKRRHRTSARRRAYDLKIQEAFVRVMTNKSTLNEEAEAIGIRGDSLRANFNRRGLLLPKREVRLHGTMYRYNRGCKCDECREAMRVDRQRRRGREPPTHGTTSAYTNFACRCEACRKAGSLRNRLDLERRKQRAKQRVLHGVPTS